MLALLLALPVAVAQRPGAGPRRGGGADAELAREGWSYSEPALATKRRGRAALAWIAFDGTAERVCAAFLDGEGWSTPLELTDEPGACLPPAIVAADGEGYWVAWPERREGDFDLWARQVRPGQSPPIGPRERVSSAAGADCEPALAVESGGRVVLAWQGRRDGNQDVWFARRGEQGWSEPARVTDDPAADIQPALAVDGAGRTWVAWSTWRHGTPADGDYEVHAARLGPEGPTGLQRVSRSPRADLFPRLVRVGPALALVWTESLFGARGKQGLTTVAYDQWRDKSYRVAWLAGDAFGTPQALEVTGAEGVRLEVSDFAAPVPSPGSAARGEPAVWLVHQTLFDRPTMQKRWGLALTEGRAGGSVSIDATAGAAGPGGRFDAAWLDGRLLAVDTANARFGTEDPVGEGRSTWLRVREIDPASGQPLRTRGEQTRDVDEEPPRERLTELPPRELRPRVTVPLAGEADEADEGTAEHAWELHAWFGNLHLHSDLSTDGRGHDGTPEMNYQVVQDLAELDFAGLSDHVEFWNDGDWWTTRKVADLWNQPGRFVTLYGYEWTSFKYGHKNVFFRDADAADAGAEIRALGQTPDDLWERLGERAAIAIPHHPSSRVTEPTDWSYRSDRFQRLVEIFQVRGNFEYDGAPLQRAGNEDKFAPGHSVQDALRMGHRLGIVASPDHGGGFGLAGVWAPELTREALFEALHARRTFGTTGAKLALWLTVAGAPQGSELDHPGGPVALHAEVESTADGLTLTVVSDGEDLESFEFEHRRAVLDWTDDRPAPEEPRYYYLRATQGDGHLGWTSPVWLD